MLIERDETRGVRKKYEKATKTRRKDVHTLGCEETCPKESDGFWLSGHVSRGG